jgi:hypothetical protein
MNYSVVSNIYLINNGVFARDAENSFVRLAYQQGGLDGACAVYSLMMCLLRLKFLTKKDLDINDSSPDCRSPKGKLLHEILENNGLVRNGFGFIQLKREIKNYLDKDFEVTRYAPKTNDDKVQRITQMLDDDIAPIISVIWKSNGAHALLAVGYEYDDDDNVTKILCLDPASSEPLVSPWNCFIDVCKKKGNYPHKVVTTTYNDDGCLDDMIAIVPRVTKVAD